MQAILLYRLSHACWKTGIPVVPAILTRLAQHLFAIDIAYQAQLGPGVVIVHGFGVVIGRASRIVGNCCIFHGVTLGDRGSEWVGSDQPDGHPLIGRGCILGAGAKLLGPITVGENCVVGANSVLIKSVPANSVVAGLPAKLISQRPTMDENLRPVSGHRQDSPKGFVEPAGGGGKGAA